MANEPQSNHRLLDAIVPVVIAVMVLIVGFIQNQISLTWPVIAAGIGLAVLSVTLGYFGARTLLRGLSRELTSSVLMAISPTKKYDTFGEKGPPALMMADELLRLEQVVECEEIWIFSEDLHDDAPASESNVDARPIVYNNIHKRDIRYTFIVPDNRLMQQKVTQKLLAGLNPHDAKKVRVHYLSAADWAKLPYGDGDIVMYNPTRRPITAPFLIAFELFRHERYWCPLPEPVAERWLARVCEIVPALYRSNVDPDS